MKQLLIIFIMSVISCTAMAHGNSNYEESDFFSTLKTGDKAAILMVHFGTTHDDTRTLTIDAINKRVKARYPDTELREAYT